MTPAARVATAIGILDEALSGQPVEQVLTTWGRQNRYAGSGDRAAIRDLVFDAVRCQRSFGWIGGGADGRALMIGRSLAAGDDPDVFFTGARHAPDPLSRDEQTRFRDLSAAAPEVRLDVQDWVLPEMERTHGAASETILDSLRHRAPVVLRANLLKATREDVIGALEIAGLETSEHPLSPTAIEVTGRVRGLQASDAFQSGLFEFQDAASQSVVDRLSEGLAGARVLDYCAGGGGKSLALAAHGARVAAHDAAPQRMRDLPARAKRAGADIAVTARPEGVYDLVFCDAPCSGSGAWRRQPESKWTLTEERLDKLNRTQDAILDTAQAHVAEGGRLAYATCSLFAAENDDRARAFLDRHPEWRQVDRVQLTPLDRGDGFFLAVFSRG